MAFKFNVFTGKLDVVNPSVTGSGVIGPATSTDNAITRWDGTTGNLIQNSKSILQDGGAIEAQAFLFHRNIQDLVTIPSEYSMIATDIVIDGGELIINDDAELVII